MSEPVKQVGPVWVNTNLDGIVEARAGVSIYGVRNARVYDNGIGDPHQPGYGKYFVRGRGSTYQEAVEALRKNFNSLCEKYRPIGKGKPF